MFHSERFSHHDPEDTCAFCDGHGFRRWFDPDCGYVHEECPICEGKATAGVFVVRMYAGTLEVEQSWQTTTFAVAVARCVRWAQLLRVFAIRRGIAVECRVLFMPDETHLDREVVYAVNVHRPQPVRAA